MQVLELIGLPLGHAKPNYFGKIAELLKLLGNFELSGGISLTQIYFHKADYMTGLEETQITWLKQSKKTMKHYFCQKNKKLWLNYRHHPIKKNF